MQNLPQTQGSTFALSPVDSAQIAEELEGLGPISLDIVKIPAGGGIMFEIPGDNPESPDVTKELTGVIVDHHPVNSYWPAAFNGNDTPPECMSLDGKTGLVLQTQECRDCKTCPMNKFGTKGVGKSCKNSHRLYILREGDSLPLILNVPPSSLKMLKEYMAKRVLFKGRKLSNVITKITLVKAKNADGITYSQAVFTKVGELTPEQEIEIKPMSDLMKVIGRVYPQPKEDDTECSELDSPIPTAQPKPVNVQQAPRAPQNQGAPFKQYQQAPIDDVPPFEDVDDLPL